MSRARSADPVSTKARGFSWGRYALRGFGTAILAVLLYAGLVRFARHPAAIFTVISAIVFVVTASVIVRLLTSTAARQPR